MPLLPTLLPDLPLPAGVMHHHDSQQLPFELVALEAALKEVVNATGMQASAAQSWVVLARVHGAPGCVERTRRQRQMRGLGCPRVTGRSRRCTCRQRSWAPPGSVLTSTPSASSASVALSIGAAAGHAGQGAGSGSAARARCAHKKCEQGRRHQYVQPARSALLGPCRALQLSLAALHAAWFGCVEKAALARLTSRACPALLCPRQVSTGNLERVRKVKTRHQRLTIRCETLRDELERFLHDDDDMVKMCLTRRKELEEQYRAVRRRQAAPTPARQLIGAGAALVQMRMSCDEDGRRRALAAIHLLSSPLERASLRR